MRVYAVQENEDGRDEPVSGARVKSCDDSAWRELVEEVQRMAHIACRNVPDHVRTDVESAAMVGLMEAVRDFDQIEPGHFDQYVKSKVWNALRAEADRFEPESSRTGALARPTSEERERAGPNKVPQLAATSAQWSEPSVAPLHVPLSDQTAEDDILTAEAAFAGSYAATALRWGLAQLEQRERLVLRLAYKRGLALAAIASRLKVSTPRAHQIRVEAERKLARLLGKSPSLGQMTEAQKPLDWDENESLRPGSGLSLA